MFGPVIRGRLVTLRPFAVADAETFVSWVNDPDVTRYLGRRRPFSLEMEREWIDRTARSETDIAWGLEHDGRLVGTSGVHGIDAENLHAHTGTLIGDRSVWGRGIAREAMQLRTRFCFMETTLHKLNSSYLEPNVASGRAQLAAGYREIGRRRHQFFREGRWIDEVLTEVLREDWLAAQSG